MLKKFNIKLFLRLLISGVLYGLSYPPFDLYFLMFFSFAFIINLASNGRSIGNLFFNSYFMFFFACLVAVSWISLSGIGENADPFLILAGFFVLIVYPLFFVIPTLVFNFISKNFFGKNKTRVLFLFPFIWTAFEYLLSLGQISFPWLMAGNSQSYNLAKIQFAEYTGVFGVSFWICMVSVVLLIIYREFKYNLTGAIFFKKALLIIILAVIYFTPDLFTYFSKSFKSYSGNKFGKEISVGIVQPNIDPWVKWGGKQNELIDNYINDINLLNREVNSLKLILLPETALPYYFRENIFHQNYIKLKDLCDSINIPVLIGTPDLNYYLDESTAPPDAKIMSLSKKKYDTYNSAFLFEPGKAKDEFQKHYKIKLVIGSERMPYQELLPFTKSLVEWGVGLSSWQIGKDTNIFILKDGSKFNTAICYESVYPGFFADFVKKGAEFSVIITNDGWWGKLAGTYQHNRFAVFRAVENRRWIARCANTGVSCFIDAYGNYYDETKIDERKNISMSVGKNDKQTFYTVNGDLFSVICYYITAAFLLAALIKRFFTSRD